MSDPSLAELKACVDQTLPEELQGPAVAFAIRENPANLPIGVSPDPKTLALQVGKKWKRPEPGQPLVLRVRFLEGHAAVQQKVIDQARKLEAICGVRFDFVKAGTAEIRIGFDTRDGSWSYIGTDCSFVAANQKTMNFGWLYPDTREAEYSSVVQHEFLHALGAIHEHQSPGATIHWDREKVYKAYGGPPNSWTKQTVDTNVLDKYGAAGMAYTEFDPHSIMLYPVDPELTTDGFGTSWNVNLSPLDREFLATHYPRADTPPEPEEPAEPPGPLPALEYAPLELGGQPVFGVAGPKGSPVYRLVMTTAVRCLISVVRVTGAGGLFVEIHKGGYPSSQRQIRPSAITTDLYPGEYYIFVKPVVPARGEGRFSLTARRTGRPR